MSTVTHEKPLLGAGLKPGSFRVLSGQESLHAWKPDGGFEKWFCGDCGSALFSRAPDDPMLVSIRFGAFDSDPQIRPSMRNFVAYAASWEAIPDDGLPRHPERAPSSEKP